MFNFLLRFKLAEGIAAECHFYRMSPELVSVKGLQRQIERGNGWGDEFNTLKNSSFCINVYFIETRGRLSLGFCQTSFDVDTDLTHTLTRTHSLAGTHTSSLETLLVFIEAAARYLSTLTMALLFGVVYNSSTFMYHLTNVFATLMSSNKLHEVVPVTATKEKQQYWVTNLSRFFFCFKRSATLEKTQTGKNMQTFYP